MAVIVGTGTSINFGTSGFAAELVGIPNISGVDRQAIEITPLNVVAPGAGQIGNRTYLPSTAVGPITLEVRFNFDPDLTPPIHGATETITITFPLPAGQSTPATWAGSGFMTSYNVEGIILDGKVEAVGTIQITGAITITPSA